MWLALAHTCLSTQFGNYISTAIILSRFINTFLHGIDIKDYFDSEPFICGEAQQRAISVAR